jgi:hypothetical protein
MTAMANFQDQSKIVDTLGGAKTPNLEGAIAGCPAQSIGDLFVFIG